MKKIKHEQPKRIAIAVETADIIEWVDMTPHQVLELLQRDVFPKFIHRKVIVNNPQHPEEEWALVNNGFIDLERRDEDIISFSVEGNVWVWNGDKHIPQENYKLPLVTFDLVKVGNKTKVEVTRGIVPDGFLERIMVALRDAVQPFELLSALVDRNKTDAVAPPNINKVELSKLIRRHYDLGEFKSLCFELQVEYEDLAGETLTNKVQALVEYLDRRGRVPHLLPLLKQQRPNTPWPDTPSN